MPSPENSDHSEAGADSPHLELDEKKQAAEHSAPQAIVIHEVIREDGEQQLKRRSSAVAWSGLAAGLSMGFSFLCLAMLTSMLPDAAWRPAVVSVGYSVGFIIVVLGRQELFTESTLSAVLPLLVRRDGETLFSLLRFWNIVFAANIVGAALFAWLLTGDLFDQTAMDALGEISTHVVRDTFVVTLLKAVLAGWLIALMVWLLPSARSAKLFVVMLLTYVVALCGLPHIIAGASEAAYAVFTNRVTWQQMLWHFLVPTLMGNTIGGVALVALLNHAPLAEELNGA